MTSLTILIAITLLGAPARPLAAGTSAKVPFPVRDGDALWATDGTARGTVFVKELIPADRHGSPDRFTPYRGAFVFLRASGMRPPALWRTDLTAAGTKPFDGIYRGRLALVGGLLVARGKLYFTGGESGNTAIWESDGTARGTAPIVDHMEPDWWVCGLTELNGALWYARVATDPDASALDALCVLRAPGKRPAECMHFQRPAGEYLFLRNRALYAVGPQVMFLSMDNALWRTNGTSAGTSLVHAFPEDASLDGFAVLGESLYFRVKSSTDTLWRSDGTAAGTVPVTTVCAHGADTFEAPAAVYEGKLYYTAYATCSADGDRFSNTELWSTDGTRQGTAFVKNLVPEVHDVRIERMFVANQRLMLLVQPPEGATELWRSDGTAAGTTLVKRIRR